MKISSYAFTLVRHGAFWFSAVDNTPFSAEYDEITETYYFQDVLTGEIYDPVRYISEDEVIVG